MALSFALGYEFLAHPYHLILQGLLAVVIAYFFFHRRSSKHDNLPLRDVDEFVAEWTPEPLPTELSKEQQRNLKELVISESGVTHVTVNGKPDVLHLARCNFLGMSGNPKLNEVAEKTMRKYGVGSCGPRGFYGSIDTHIFLEHRISKFLESEDAILYSSSFCTISSAIPAFSKRGDIIICDKGVTHSIQTGITLSRSTVHYFNHNDMADLERVLIETMPTHPKKLVRKFLVVEALYYNYGDMCPLKEILALKDKYKFRIFLDESTSFGVLGKTGRGLTELLGVDRKQIEVLTGALGNAFGAGGGFCVGDKMNIYHQRLNGSGYVFSASLPPFLSACAETAIDLLDENPTLVHTLHANTKQFHSKWRELAERKAAGADKGDLGLEITSLVESPVILLRLTPSRQTGTRDSDEDRLQAICDHMLEHSNILISRAKYIAKEMFIPPPSLRVCMNAALEPRHVDNAVEALRKAVEAVCE